MIKTMKKAFVALAIAFGVSAFGLGSGAAFETAIAPDQVRASCEDDKCDGASSCVNTSNAYQCNVNDDRCWTYACGPE